MPQGDYIELFRKRNGYRLDHHERARKRAARLVKTNAALAKAVRGRRAKLHNARRRTEKIEMKKTIHLHEQKSKTADVADDEAEARQGALPHYLLDRKEVSRAKVLSNMVKQKRKEKAGRWDVPLPKVRPLSEEEVFSVIKTGKRRAKMWKRRITKVTFVPPTFTRKPPKYERFVRPTGLRMNKAHVTHPELKSTFQLEILGVKKNPSSALFTQLGVVTKGTVIEVNVAELGLVTQSGKVVWAKYAQVTNNPENDGMINAVLLV